MVSRLASGGVVGMWAIGTSSQQRQTSQGGVVPARPPGADVPAVLSRHSKHCGDLQALALVVTLGCHACT